MSYFQNSYIFEVIKMDITKFAFEFLNKAVPKLIKSQYDFLLHSMLALAASDLACKPHESAFRTASTSTISSPSTSSSHSIQTTSDQRALSAAALHHRVLAIKSLQNALAQGIKDTEAGNAMLATCYVLVFQSSLISDGFPEFMSFIRGCMVVAFQMGVKRMKFIFENMMPDDQLRVVGPSLERDPGLASSVTDPAIESLRKCEHLMMKPYVKEFFSALMEIAVKSQESSRGGGYHFSPSLGAFADFCLSLSWDNAPLRHLRLHHERSRLHSLHRSFQHCWTPLTSPSCRHANHP